MARLFAGAALCLLLAGLVWGGESGMQVGLGTETGINLTPQNDRIAVFGGDLVGDIYTTHLGLIVGRPVDVRVGPHPLSAQSGTVGSALSFSDWFSQPGNEYGIIITDYGAWDRVFGDETHKKMEVTPWETTEANLRELFRRLKATGAIVVYNQVVPESECPFGTICEEEGVIRVPDWKKDMFVVPGPGKYFRHMCWSNGIYQSPLPESECEFIRYWKEFVLAERTARVMQDVGIVEWAEPCDLESLDFEGLYSNASQLLDELVELDLATEEVDLNTTRMEWWLAQAEPLYEVGACFTTRCLLRAGIEPLRIAVEHWDDIQELFRLWEKDFDYEPTDWPVYPHLWFREQGGWSDAEIYRLTIIFRVAFSLEHWDEVVEMFANASALLDDAEELGIGTSYQHMCYDLAKMKWRDLDYDSVDANLARIHADLESKVISGLASQADGKIVGLEGVGFDCQKMRGELALVEASWQVGNCSYDAAKEGLEEIADRLDVFLLHADGLREMFSQADECIEAFRQAGDTGNVTLLQAEYACAMEACAALDYESACIPLNAIMERCPEPMLLPLLGLLLLPMLKRLRDGANPGLGARTQRNSDRQPWRSEIMRTRRV